MAAMPEPGMGERPLVEVPADATDRNTRRVDARFHWASLCGLMELLDNPL